MSKPLANAFIAAVMIYQVAMPLRYYLGEGGYDERFSWRMFSTVRLHKCKATVKETRDGVERLVNLKRDIQTAWINQLQRYRPAVVEKYMNRRCDLEGVVLVRYQRSCVDTDGTRLPPMELVMSCSDRSIEEVDL